MASSILPGLINHLWQTTLFVAVLALLTLALKHNGARFRYWVWLATSAKFLVPFSVLVSIGPLIGIRDLPLHPVAAPISSIAMQITAPVAVAYSATTLPTTGNFMDWLASHSAWLALAWTAGFVAMTLAWLLEWLRTREVIRNSTQSNHDFLVPVRISHANVEPGIAGIFRAVLILPSGLDEQLRPDQFSAVLAHERCHLRRRDNFAAALHRFVQSVFWFHPFVWMIADQLATERERACDEQVVEEGHEPKSYAEGILTICELCIRRRAPGMAMAGGGKLRERIAAIVRDEPPRSIDAGRKLLMLAMVVATVAAPIIVGALAPSASLAQGATSSAAEIELKNVSIASSSATVGMVMLKMGTDGRLETLSFPLRNLIAAAYRVPLPQVDGHGLDIESRYNVSAEISAPPRDADTYPNALKSLLATRFGLKVRIERRSVSGYALRVSRGALKIKASSANVGPVSISQVSMDVTDSPLSVLTNFLSNSLDAPVADETGLSGGFSYKLWLRPSSEYVKPWTGIGPALEDQLGLILERKMVSVEFVDVVTIRAPIA